MTAFVVDASMAAAWVLPDERSALADDLLDRIEAEAGLVPSIFWHEVRNVLLKVERSGRGRPAATDAALRRLKQLPLSIAEDRGDAAVMTLARRHNLTAYDAAYLDVAIGSALPLATADRRLAAGAKAGGVIVLGPYARAMS